jgi:hypothetical protein
MIQWRKVGLKTWSKTLSNVIPVPHHENAMILTEINKTRVAQGRSLLARRD